MRAHSDAFQGAGIAPELIAEATLQAIRDNRFYIFYGDTVQSYLHSVLDPTLADEAPPVITWGPDLRPADERG